MADEDEPLSFEEHRRRDDNPSLVPCARCGKRILVTATRCSECGVHFQGEAQEFAHTSERQVEGGTPVWVIVLAVLVLVALLIGFVAR